MSGDDQRVALVTGGNRGLGFETCRGLGGLGYRVLLTARDRGLGEEAAEVLRGEGLEVVFHKLDVSERSDVGEVSAWVRREFGRLDVLINNAGVYLDSEAVSRPASFFEVPLETVERTMRTNVYGPYLLCQALVPLMKENNYGRVVNVSSGMGRLEGMSGMAPAYRMSKCAVNAITRVLADEVKGYNILVNSVTPGWARTRMGGSRADLSPADGAKRLVHAATLQDGGPSGAFLRNFQPDHF